MLAAYGLQATSLRVISIVKGVILLQLLLAVLFLVLLKAVTGLYHKKTLQDFAQKTGFGLE